MKEQKNNTRGIFYGVIGIATLVVAIIGATFAYFTASASNNNTITGDMATITFNLAVTKMTDVDETKGGMIPMSNSMVQAAVNNPTADGGPCVDDNGNAVCQIYKITVSNTGTASLFLDGYVTLNGGSGAATDFTSWTNNTVAESQTTMRWAQVFTSGDVYTTVGRSTTGAGQTVSGDNVTGVTSDWATLAAPDNAGTAYSHNTDNIKTSFSDVTAKAGISGNDYDIINRNYIRVSDRSTTATNYTRTTDVTSALVFNQYLDAQGGTTASRDLYIVVWLSENGKNQTVGSTEANIPESGLEFFSGDVVFNSAQGSEVTATFSGFVSVRSDNA